VKKGGMFTVSTKLKIYAYVFFVYLLLKHKLEIIKRAHKEPSVVEPFYALLLAFFLLKNPNN